MDPIKKKTAVILYGYMRTFKDTAPHLIKNILMVNNADLFIFCYENEGTSNIINMENVNNEKNKNAVKWDSEGGLITESLLRSIYEDFLVEFSINKYNRNFFMEESKNIFSPVLPIERFYSLYWNMSNSVKMLNRYREKNNIEYESVLITRPDLIFYDIVDLSVCDRKKISVPTHGGNFLFGEKPKPYFACYYKNVERGELIPWNTVVFSDQFIYSSFDNIIKLLTLYENLSFYNKIGVPVCHPETVLYYHLSLSNKIPVNTIDIVYEILRSTTVKVSNELLLAFPPQKDSLDIHSNTKQVNLPVRSLFIRYLKRVAKTILNQN